MSSRRLWAWHVTVSAVLVLVQACVVGQMGWPGQAEAAPRQMQFPAADADAAEALLQRGHHLLL